MMLSSLQLPCQVGMVAIIIIIIFIIVKQAKGEAERVTCPRRKHNSNWGPPKSQLGLAATISDSSWPSAYSPGASNLHNSVPASFKILYTVKATRFAAIFSPFLPIYAIKNAQRRRKPPMWSCSWSGRHHGLPFHLTVVTGIASSNWAWGSDYQWLLILSIVHFLTLMFP